MRLIAEKYGIYIDLVKLILILRCFTVSLPMPHTFCMLVLTS